MVKLTHELIINSYQHINPCRDRELDLRGYKIPLIENLGATLNQFDTIDFSDNDIRKLDNFPLLPRLKAILMNNNRVVRISESIIESLPNLEMLILTNNMMSDLSDLDILSRIPKLAHLSLLFNPVSTKPHYREYVIFKLEGLKVLDFRKIKEKERAEAKKFFKTQEGKEIRKEIAKSAKHLENEEDLRKVQTDEEINAIKKAIQNASTLEEVERLNQILRSGQIPRGFSADQPMDVEWVENNN